MKGITYCGACADYDIKKHRCKCGAKLESNPQDKFFDDCPLPDAVPVVHGRWIHSRYEDCSEQFELVKCSRCSHEAYAMAFYVRGGNYCPNCGARMDGDGDA